MMFLVQLENSVIKLKWTRNALNMSLLKSSFLSDRQWAIVASIFMMATAAFGGYDLVSEAYQKALKNNYKFGCYGDAMLILND